MNGFKQLISSTIKVDVEFFDDTHKDLLCDRNKYPIEVIRKMKHAVKNGLSISGVDFLTYYLFHNKRYGIDKQNFIEAIPAQSDLLSLHLDVNNSQMFKRHNVALPKEITEHIGESVGMLLISHCFNITSADWGFISESNKAKTLDCSLAISDDALIELEAKGTSAKVLNLSGPSNSILDKKKENKRPKGNYSYGSITTIDMQRLTCYLLDPPGTDKRLDYTRLRFINNLKYYNEVFKVIAPKSELIDVLNERIEEINSSEGYSFDTLRPKNRYEFNYGSGNEPTFFFRSYYHERGPVKFGGRFFYINKSTTLFVGVTNDLLNRVVGQDPFNISSHDERVNIVSINEKVNGSAFQKTQRDESDINSMDNAFGNKEGVRVKGRVYIKNGLALGILDYN
ncbi:TPA: hypothetical protein MA044_004313 [Klebsiella pneumoniae]|nr:hypothetical protein [Klebsiella pneumoniae]HBT0440098.1 hypothetical protein [Klebsiella pneumoniae]HBZ0094257.1 hypothetical protein [Klebsiella pneumoniae]HDK6052197.1 hypothetical protein [Klebsiella variicola]